MATWRALLLAGVGLSLAPSFAAAREFHVEPSRGSPSGDGSEANPWRTLEQVVADGLLTDGTVAGGDTLLLGSGYHGQLAISGGGNAAPIVIAAAPGATPQLRRVLFQNTHGWTLRGVSVSPSFAPIFQVATLVDVAGAGSRDIVIEDNRLFSVPDVGGWDAADWIANACNGIEVDGSNVVVRGNHVLNTRFGISVSGPDALVSRNVVENFSADGMRGLGDRDVFEYNLMANLYDVDDNHDDGFQSWSVGPGGVGTGEVVGVVLRGNDWTIENFPVSRTALDPDRPAQGRAAEHRFGGAQQPGHRPRHPGRADHDRGSQHRDDRSRRLLRRRRRV